MYKRGILNKFQSTLPREERRKRCRRKFQCNYFNPRSHERSDKKFVPEQLEHIISIHAPTRGATTIPSDVTGYLNDFNPRSHERSDKLRICCIQQLILFQSTLPREERQVHSLCLQDTVMIFQSTLPREERQKPLQLYQLMTLFQSTLPREERLHLLRQCCEALTISIHAPTRGATMCL